MSEIKITPMQEILEKLFIKTLLACKKAGAINNLEDMKQKLEAEHITPKEIEQELTQELKSLCLHEYEEAVGGSDRNQGKGYSSMKIEQYMKTLLKNKLKKFASLLSQEPEIEIKKKSFEQIMNEI